MTEYLQGILFPEMGLNVRPQENFKYTDQMEFRIHTHLLGHVKLNAGWLGSPSLAQCCHFQVKTQNEVLISGRTTASIASRKMEKGRKESLRVAGLIAS